MRIGKSRLPSRNRALLKALSKAAHLAALYDNGGKNKAKALYLDNILNSEKEVIESMKFRKIMTALIVISVIGVSLYSFVFDKKSEKTATIKRDAKAQKLYGEDVKIYDHSKYYSNIYKNYGNDVRLSTISADYLGRSLNLLNVNLVNKEFKPDYINYQFSVDELPLDLKGFDQLFSAEDREDSKGKRENVVIEFSVDDNIGLRSQHTMIVDFSEMANSVDPIVTYGLDQDENKKRKKLHIKKIKSAEFIFEGESKKYFVGANNPFGSQQLKLQYDPTAKNYKYKSSEREGVIDMDKILDLYNGFEGELIPELKFGAIVNNIKSAQNKYIKSGGYYKVDGIIRFLSNIDLNVDYPMRSMYKGEALMRHVGTSLSDGQSYVKYILDDTQIGLLINTEGYITQYQQVVVDKKKGVVEKIVLVRK